MGGRGLWEVPPMSASYDCPGVRVLFPFDSIVLHLIRCDVARCMGFRVMPFDSIVFHLIPSYLRLVNEVLAESQMSPLDEIKWAPFGLIRSD